MNPSINYISIQDKLNIKIDNVVTFSELAEPRSPDEFDINVIDLSIDSLWKNNQNATNQINSQNDLKNLYSIIKNSRSTKFVILLPQDLTFRYSFTYSYGEGKKTFQQACRLKDMLRQLESILNTLFPLGIGILSFEPTRTIIGESEVTASFYFNMGGALTSSVKSRKRTTILHDNFYITALNIDSVDKLFQLLRHIGLVQNEECDPAWLFNICFWDDQQQRKKICDERETIRNANEIIENSENILSKNSRYKSILYTNGDRLVSVVFDILQQILDCDLSGFTDEKKEDFCIKLSTLTFLGEIKGVSTNIKSEHISQLDVHLQGYIDNLGDAKTETVKSLLIINHQRTKPLCDREPAHNKQIALAERNESLIIETYTLLKIFEMFCSGDLNSDQIVEILSKKTGMLTID